MIEFLEELRRQRHPEKE